MESHNAGAEKKDKNRTKKNRPRSSTHARFLRHLEQITVYKNYRRQASEVTTDGMDFIPITALPKPLPESDEEDGDTDDDFTIIEPKTPLKHRSNDLYKRKDEEQKVPPSFHEVYRVIKKRSKKKLIYFFKRNKLNVDDSVMCQLEATACEFYGFIAPQQVSSANVIYDKKTKKIIGINSEGIPGFKSVFEKPLYEEDLLVSALDYFSVPELEKIDLGLKKAKVNIEDLEDKQKLFSKEVDGKTVIVTVKDIKNFRIVMGNAIGLILSFFFEDDDPHRGNIDKYGRRIDFDMSLWPILFLFKETGYVDWTFRHPSGRFPITEEDILNFPNLKDASPFYWPTEPPPVIPPGIRDWLSKFFNLGNNAFTPEQNRVYQKLATHPVFIYYKFATLLRLILTTEQMYRNLAKLHMREDMEKKFGPDGKQPLIDYLCQHVGNRLKELKNVLIGMPVFQDFMANHGEKILESLVNEIKVRNDHFKRKAEKKPGYGEQIIDTTIFYDNFADIKKEIESRSVKVADEEVDSLLSSKEIGKNSVIVADEEVNSLFTTVSNTTFIK